MSEHAHLLSSSSALQSNMSIPECQQLMSDDACFLMITRKKKIGRDAHPHGLT